MKAKLYTAILVLALVLPLPAAALGAADAAPGLAGLDAQIESIMAEWKVPGLGLAVVQDGKVVLATGYGYRNVEERLPVTKSTLFAIGSNSKSFTATLLGMLNDEGKLDWDRPVREVLPDFQLYDPVATVQMTPRDLVTHRSGLPRHDLLWYASGLSREELYRRLRYLEPSEPFRSVFQYQNLMFMTAGYLAGKIAGSSWEELVDERILTPLGMERTQFSVDEMEGAGDFAYPYVEVDDQIERIPYRNIDEVGPAGSINSSVEEMARYVQFHIDSGAVDGEQLLSVANSKQMQSPQMVIGGPIAERFNADPEIGPGSYGLGLMVASYRGHRYVYHGGGIDGFISAMEWLPDDRVGVVVLTNFSGTNPVPTIVARTVFDRMLGLEPIDWSGRAKARVAEAEKSAEEAKAAEATDRKQGTQPTHALADYTASYEHPGYGRAVVEATDQGLEMSVAGFTVPLEHYHYDIFAVPRDLGPPLDNLGGTKVTFSYDKKGDIDRVAVPLEPNVSDIVFERLGDEAMSELAFLERLVGEYTLAGQVATVSLAGDSLRLTVPGQPTYTLEPDRGTSFDIEGAPGFRVEFEVEGETAAKAVTFHQPNGTLTAKRK